MSAFDKLASFLLLINFSKGKDFYGKFKKSWEGIDEIKEINFGN